MPRILVVEDEPTIRNLVAEVLAEEGFEVERAADGVDALRVLSDVTAVDLVVLDMWMPVMNGWQFAAALKERGLQTPLVAMTAARDARTYATEIGAVGFIGKPFSIDQLVRTVRDALPTENGDGL